ncbi:metal ABC transporter permease [Liquorilactobacillus vini]|uniref:Zinc abc transporterinner membrane permease protein n=1 Tax=Liquorilactobacillus vini DSM 20605 TaxID=1133569 RepID=A0A0R2CA31_9LACO|nr:metal ABC transporter permease [Liquorilactobacillus vini]KRM88669.1 zinc abc transporterinner membrane permease protein [Liquorilactobacillus vini DSM 20605]
MFNFAFMRYAFAAGTAVAILCGVIGVFVVARRLPFMTHTLSEIGFSGAAFGAWIGWTPLQGMMVFTVLSALAADQLGISEQSSNHASDSVISAVSAFFMGLGVLFLSLSSQNASYATSILFGSIVGITQQNVWQILTIAIIVLGILALIYRKLKFDSFDSTGAETEHVSRHWMTLTFLIMVALSVSVAAQIVGALLIFVLLTLPSSAAQPFCRSVGGLIGLSIVLALIGTWGGLYLGYLTNWPVTFFIATIETVFYLLSLAYRKLNESA